MNKIDKGFDNDHLQRANDPVFLCCYKNHPYLIEEYTKAFMKADSNMMMGLGIACLLLFVLTWNKDQAQSVLWLSVACLLIFSFWFFNDRSVCKRALRKYKKRYGTVETDIQIRISDTIQCQVQNQSRTYSFKNIVRMTETEHLVLVIFAKAMIPIHKEHLEIGTLDELRIILDKNQNKKE